MPTSTYSTLRTSRVTVVDIDWRMYPLDLLRYVRVLG